MEIVKFNKNEMLIQKFNGEFYFAVKDVCLNLGLTNTTQSLKGIPERCIKSLVCELTLNEVTSKARKTQKLLFVNESGLYRLTFKSRKQEAILFQDFVFDTLLPTLRNTGSFSLKERSNEWLQKRQEGKGIRTAEMEVVQRFVEYAIIQGASAKGVQMYYSTFTNEVYKALDISKGKRDETSGLQLYQLSILEMTISNSLSKSMDSNIHYKECYKQAKKDFLQVATLAGFKANNKFHKLK